jgi:uncharacterized phage infection (PIP) family protein YhgE
MRKNIQNESSDEKLAELGKSLERELKNVEDPKREQAMSGLLQDIAEKRIALKSSEAAGKAFRAAMTSYRELDELHERYEGKLAVYNEAVKRLDESYDKLEEEGLSEDQEKELFSVLDETSKQYVDTLHEAQTATVLLHEGVKTAEKALRDFSGREDIPAEYKGRTLRLSERLGEMLNTVDRSSEELRTRSDEWKKRSERMESFKQKAKAPPDKSKQDLMEQIRKGPDTKLRHVEPETTTKKPVTGRYGELEEKILKAREQAEEEKPSEEEWEEEPPKA